MSRALAVETKKYLTFTLADEVFALDISRVREVLNSKVVTKVPKMPDYMSGVINLRGGAVSVVDIRIIFEMPETESDADSCIIIVEIVLGDESIIIGVLVDAVQEVIELGTDQIEAAPKIGAALNTEFIQGMGKRGEDFMIILNIDKVFSTEELTAVQDAGRLESAESDEIVHR